MSRLSQVLRGDKWLWIIYSSLVIISVISMFSASSQLISSTNNISGPIRQHVFWLVVGFGLLSVTHNVSNRFVRLGSYFLLFVSFGFMIYLFLQLIASDSESARIVSLGGAKFQPAELARLSLFIVTADFIERLHLAKGRQQKILFWTIIVIIDVMVLLVAVSNLSTALLMYATCFVMFFLGGMLKKPVWVNLVAIVVLIGAVLAFDRAVPRQGEFRDFLRTTPMRRAETWNSRLDHLFDGDQTKESGNFEIRDDNRQSSYSHIAIARGGLRPHMPGTSMMRNYLANVYNDYIYALIVEESGIILSLLVLLLYFVVFYRSGKIMIASATIYHAVLSGGIGFVILAQALVHVFVCVSNFVTGQPLPLISQGGMSICVVSTYFGLLMSASVFSKQSRESGLELSDSILTMRERRKAEKEFVRAQQQNDEVSTTDDDSATTDPDASQEADEEPTTETIVESRQEPATGEPAPVPPSMQDRDDSVEIEIINPDNDE